MAVNGNDAMSRFNQDSKLGTRDDESFPPALDFASSVSRIIDTSHWDVKSCSENK